VDGLGQAIEQGVDTGSRSSESGFEGVALLGQGFDLLHQERIGALQLGVAQQQALNAFCDLLDLKRETHPDIVRLLKEN
jgi:hypothetical protein